MEKIVIVGGGMTGCSIAYYLAKAGITQDVVVIEADPTYEFAATPRSVGGIRSVFGVKENVEMSLTDLMCLKILTSFSELMLASFMQVLPNKAICML